jgi:hypothetical protein
MHRENTSQFGFRFRRLVAKRLDDASSCITPTDVACSLAAIVDPGISSQ